MMVHFFNLFNYFEKNKELTEAVINSWKILMPELEIKIWTEDDEFMRNILESSEICRDSVTRKNIGNLFDYLRLFLQLEFGGIVSESDMILMNRFEINEDTEFCFSFEHLNALSTTYGPILIKNKKILSHNINIIQKMFSMDKDFLHYSNEIERNNLKYFDGRQDYFSELKQKTSKIKNPVIHLFDYPFTMYKKIIFTDNMDKIIDSEKESTFLFQKDTDSYLYHRKDGVRVFDYRIKEIYESFLNFLKKKNKAITSEIINDNCLNLDNKQTIFESWKKYQGICQ